MPNIIKPWEKNLLEETTKFLYQRRPVFASFPVNKLAVTQGTTRHQMKDMHINPIHFPRRIFDEIFSIVRLIRIKLHSLVTVPWMIIQNMAKHHRYQQEHKAKERVKEEEEERTSP